MAIIFIREGGFFAKLKTTLDLARVVSSFRLPYQGVVAQLVRASACHAEGRGFESRPSRQLSRP